MNKQINKLFNEIGNNTLNNEKTSIGIIEQYTILNNENKFKINSYSIYTILGVKNNAGIVSELRGQDTLIKLQGIRKSVVDRLILPIADFKHLVEVDEKKTKVEKNKDKAEKKANVEVDKVANKSDEKIKSNAIRTTANNICYPILFLCSQDKANYKFKDNRVMVNVMALSDEVVKSVFGFKKEKIVVEQGTKFFVQCNFTLLQKLSQKVLFKVEVMRKITEENETESLEESTEELTKGAYSKDKAKKMLKSICSQLDYFDKNNSYDEILQVENHIRTLENYGEELELIVQALRKQTNNSINKDIYGSWVVDNNNSVELSANTMDKLREQFNKQFKVA
tara:strand:- start:127 stop:1140 length:1014 start_codon:yes stop_codon:yes gene_type:complete